MVIKVDFTEEEYFLIQEIAKTYGLSVSEYIRKTVLKHIENEFNLKNREIY